MARALAPAMRERGAGHLVFIASLAGKAASPRSSVYNATKFGLRGFALGLRADLLGAGRAQACRRLGAAGGEHAGLADEARRDQGDADRARGQVGAQAEREAAQAELGRVIYGGAGAGRLAGK